MTDTPKKKGRGRPKKTVNPEAQKAAVGALKKTIIAEGNTSGVPNNVIWGFVLEKEAIKKEKAETAKKEKDLHGRIKANSISLTAFSDIMRLRALAPEVMLNRIEDQRIIAQACPDMEQLDLWGTKAIQKYVDGQKQKDGKPAAPAAAVATNGNGAAPSIAQQKADAPNPEDAGKAMMGTKTEQPPAEPPVAAAVPRRVGEVITH